MARGYGDERDFTNRRLPQDEKFRSGWIDFPNYLRSEPVASAGEVDPSLVEEEQQAQAEAGRYLPFVTRAHQLGRRPERSLSPRFVEERPERSVSPRFVEERPVSQRFVEERRAPLWQLESQRPVSQEVSLQLMEPERPLEEEPAFVVQQHQTVEDAFPTFRRQAHQRKNAEEWRAFLQEKPAHKPRFVPSTVPSILKGMPAYEEKKQQAQLMDYERLEEALIVNPDDLLVFDTQASSQEGAPTHKSERPTRPQPAAFQSQYQPALQKPLRPTQEAIQESLLQEKEAPTRQPLPGKQRRAMNRSLSWIMEQEQKNQEIPYV